MKVRVPQKLWLLLLEGSWKGKLFLWKPCLPFLWRDFTLDPPFFLTCLKIYCRFIKLLFFGWDFKGKISPEGQRQKNATATQTKENTLDPPWRPPAFNPAHFYTFDWSIFLEYVSTSVCVCLSKTDVIPFVFVEIYLLFIKTVSIDLFSYFNTNC